MMASALRESLRDAGVTVTNVFPGFTDTDMMATEDVPKARPAADRRAGPRGLGGRGGERLPGPVRPARARAHAVRTSTPSSTSPGAS